MAIRQRDYEVAEARAILDAVRELQTNPQLLDSARTDIGAVMDCLGLSGTVRHAVAGALALSIGGVALVPGTPVFWTA